MYGPMFAALCKQALPQPVPVWDSVPPPNWEAHRAFIVYQNIGGVPVYFSEGDIADKRNVRLQVTVWTKDPADRYALSNRLLRAVAKHPQMEPLTEVQDDFDNPMKLYGARFDLSLWFEAPDLLP